MCQEFFLTILDISEGRVKYCLSFKRSETNTPIADRRGKAEGCTYNRANPCREESIDRHIQSFQTVESHYARQTSKYEYLPDGLNLSKMYRLYSDWCNEQNINAETKGLYYRTFHSRFNLKFNKLKKDACDMCTSYKNTPEELKREAIREEFNCHIAEKIKAREHKTAMKGKAREYSWVSAAAFDMQKVLLLLHRETSSFYHSRRLKVQNFTITEINTMKTFCYLWDETQGKKGYAKLALLSLAF